MSDTATATVFVPVDVGAAFDAFTLEVDAWWRRGPAYRFRTGFNGVLRFDPGVGGRLVEDYGAGEVYEVGGVLAWEPGERLVFQFRPRNFAPDEATEVEVRFKSAGDGTEVTLEHRGFETLRPGHPACHGLRGPALARLHGAWWLVLMRELCARVGARA